MTCFSSCDMSGKCSTPILEAVSAGHDLPISKPASSGRWDLRGFILSTCKSTVGVPDPDIMVWGSSPPHEQRRQLSLLPACSSLWFQPHQRRGALSKSHTHPQHL